MNPQGFRWIWLPTRLAIYVRDDWTCYACRRTLRWQKGRGHWSDATRADAPSLDHVEPRVLGGASTPSNLVLACVGCNSARHDQRIVDWRPELVPVVLERVARPLDRATGARLARALDPAGAMREVARGGAKRARRAALRQCG